MASEMIEIRWHGRGGQGAKTAAEMVARAALQEVTAQLFADIHHAGRQSPAVASLLHRRLPVLAGLPEIDVDRMDAITLVLQPTEND